MATHQETRARKAQLVADLRCAYEQGHEAAGKALSQRALSERYGLSMQTVGVELQKLVVEGVLYTVPRVGTFLGRPATARGGLNVLLTHRSPIGHKLFDAVLTGFEERVATLGGASDCLTVAQAVAIQRQSGMALPRTSGAASLNTAGIFLLDATGSPDYPKFERPAVPCVAYAGRWHGVAQADTVDFDNEEGGEQAARHLLNVGHRRIAFLGMHGQTETRDEFDWSRERQAGWLRMMERAGQATDNLAFRPVTNQIGDLQQQVANARSAAQQLLKQSDATAIIAAGVFALHGLVQALCDAGTDPARWPAIVCFDETDVSRASGVSYLRLPWEKLGAEAAQLLWERQSGRLTGAPQRRLIKMTLIPRLTCHPDWAQNSNWSGNRLVDLASTYASSP